MDTINLPRDFREFLKLLNAHNVDYLLVGGYAVAFHGYPRATADMDIWVAVNAVNAGKLVDVLKEFGFDVAELSAELFLTENQIIRLGMPPMRIEIHTSISGVDFDACYANRVMTQWDGVDVPLINLEQLKINKAASGRYKDLNDLEHLSD